MSKPTGDAQGGGLALELDVAAVQRELAKPEPETSADSELESQAESYAERLYVVEAKDHQTQERYRAAVERMGDALQKQAAHRSRMLQQPIKQLSERGDDGGPVANALIELKMKVEELDPNRFDFSPGWATRLLGQLPGIGTPLKRYFSRYEKAQTIIDAIIESLRQGRAQLERDNVTLAEDQAAMRDLTLSLERQVELGQLIDGKILHRLERTPPGDTAQREFIEQEILFALRQRIIDLQQQLAVNQQGILSIAVIIRNNRELMRGVDRAIDLTVSALQVAVTVALALANQKIVLDKIAALRETTSNLITGTAARLREQGTAIATQASSAMLDMETLRGAFANISTAMDEISRFRSEALPRMATTILEFNALTDKGEEAVRKLERAEAMNPEFEITAD